MNPTDLGYILGAATFTLAALIIGAIAAFHRGTHTTHQNERGR